jgi:Mg2+-importing ATPase
VLDRYAAYGRGGFRVLGLAVKRVEGRIGRQDECDMALAGFILIEDPLKEDVHASLEALERMGVSVKIVTGDNRHAAAHVAEQLRLMEPGILTGPDIDRMSPEALVVKARETDIFAEIAPHQKERIVKALQASGHCVAYMGDGINDVSAIHAADVGISTENATDVARDAADFVLLDKGLSVLAEGILEGRRSFANAMKYVYITTGATFGNMFSVAAAAVFLPFLPMLPKQILLNNLVSDLPFLAIAADRVEDEQLRRPRRWDLRLIRRFMVVFGIHSSLFDLATFGLLYVHWRLDAEAFRTGWFIESTLTEVIILFVMRTRAAVWRSRPGHWLLLAASAAVLLAVMLPSSPLGPALGFARPDATLWLGLAAILAAYTLTADLLKVHFFRRMLPAGDVRQPPP